MKQNRKSILSAIIFSGAIGLLVGPAWSQQTPSPRPGGGTSGTTQQKDDALGQQPGSKMGADTGKMESDATSKSSERGKAGTELGKSDAGKTDSEAGKMGSAPRREVQKYSQQTIKEVQQALKDKGHDPGAIDGIIGEHTRQALRDFQKSNNLKATGSLDEETAQKLGVSLSSGMPATPSGAMSEGKPSSEKPSGAKPSGSKPSGAGSAPEPKP